MVSSVDNDIQDAILRVSALLLWLLEHKNFSLHRLTVAIPTTSYITKFLQMQAYRK